MSVSSFCCVSRRPYHHFHHLPSCCIHVIISIICHLSHLSSDPSACLKSFINVAFKATACCSIIATFGGCLFVSRTTTPSSSVAMLSSSETFVFPCQSVVSLYRCLPSNCLLFTHCHVTWLPVVRARPSESPTPPAVLWRIAAG